ncbi:MAG: hypothetical protein QOG63_1957 [Thermoleophilaceae bacterium]|jgi:hypothetical protein|nr:hypothetical protein [Thermoleophilaceae bacterium]
MAPALALIALAIPASASAQATRTWVSGVGDDVNPCSRTAPCKTFAGAISKTAAGGEINCLDPGGFGGVTITKALAIKCRYTEGGVLVSGTNGIVVNAGANDKVTIAGLDINGLNGTTSPGLNGIRITSAKTVHIIDNEIYGFNGAGIDVNPTSTQMRVVAAHNHIHDNAVGFMQAPGNNAISFTASVVRWNDIQGNICGIVSSAFGQTTTGAFASPATDCGASPNTGTNRTVVTNAYHNGINLNAFGVFDRGASAVTGMAWNDITNNDTFGIHTVDGGVLKTYTPATNVIDGNGADDPTNASVPLKKRGR